MALASRRSYSCVSSGIRIMALVLAATACLSFPRGSWAESSTRPRVFIGEEKLDTLDAPAREVRQAAERALEDDHWNIAKETTDRRVVTEWKPLRHTLTRMLMGNVRARCVVDMVALAEGRTEVHFSGAIGSDVDHESGPNPSLAEAAYEKAVKIFFRDVRAGVSQRLDEKEEPTSENELGPQTKTLNR